jgi:hypothetical protein
VAARHSYPDHHSDFAALALTPRDAGSGKAGFSRAPGPGRLLVVEDQEWLSGLIAEGLAPL